MADKNTMTTSQPSGQVPTDVAPPAIQTAANQARAQLQEERTSQSEFLTELDSETWLARYSCGDRLGDPTAVSSVPAYSAWLRRIATAWSAMPMPTTSQAEFAWAFSSQPPSSLAALAFVDMDLRAMSRASGGPHYRTVTQRNAPMTAEDEDVDGAYVAGALYVAVAVAQEVSVLAADVEHLSQTRCHTPLPQHYMCYSKQLAETRNQIRSELAAWAADAGPQASERVILASRLLLDTMSVALVNGHGGW